MLSIHHMLNFEPGKDDPSPELLCYLSESLRNMEKEVPEERTFDPKFIRDEIDDEIEDLDLDFSYDETNLSFEQLQEYFLATQAIPQENLRHWPRPHLVIKKQKLLWTIKRVEDLKLASKLAWQKFRMNKKPSVKDLLCQQWFKLNPNMVKKVSKNQILARYKFQIRYEKRISRKNSQRVITTWQTMCDNFRVNEENIEVIDETNVEAKKVENKLEPKITNKIMMGYNGDPSTRDYNRDEDVLSYLR